MTLYPHRQILLDAVEKICRLHNLSRAIRYVATQEEIALLKFYEAQLEGVRDRLELTIDQILNNESEFSVPDYGPLYDTLSYFHNLHPQFRVFATLPEISKEIFITLENLLPKENYERLKPTIIYSPHYNYFELSTLEYFQNLGILLEIGIPDRIILMLPYADLENPLMWSVLVHELSHAFEATLGIVDEVAESFSAQSEKIIRRSKNWAREFCCDMIAIKLMGPSYLNAFLNLAFSINPWHHLHSDSHPQPYSRINYMSKYLDGSSERPSIHSSSSNHYTKVFRELYDKFSIQEETVQLAIRQEDLIQGLEQKISEITFPGEIGNGYLAITSNLTKKLKDGIPLISSYRSTPVEKITKKMEQFSNNQDAAPDDKIKELYDLLGLANEKPAKPADIVNAAWDYRAEKFWDLFKEIFTDSQLSYEEKFVKFAEHIDNFNYSIIKSLEISKIHQIFQPGEVK